MASERSAKLAAAANAPITVGLLEDDPDTREFLMAIIDDAPSLTLQFAAETLRDARAKIQDMKNGDPAPQICLVDLQLPDGHGTRFIREFRSAIPDSRALVLTSLGDRESVVAAFSSGASGYILKDTPGLQIERDIDAVIRGGIPISPQAARHMLGLMALPSGTKSTPSPDDDTAGLTDRESDVLNAFAKGLSYQETSDALGISVHTVRHHVKAIYRKLSVHSRSEAIFEAMQMGLLSL